MANQHTRGENRRMTEQQQRFVDHFLQYGNGAQAAKAAGFAHPEQASVKLMAKTHIRKYLHQATQARAMSYVPDMMDELAHIALDREMTQPKDRIAAAVAILDRAGVPNGTKGTNINIDNSTKTVNMGGAEVAQLIASVWNRGQGGQQIAAPDVSVPQITDQSQAEDAEFEPVDRASDDDD